MKKQLFGLAGAMMLAATSAQARDVDITLTNLTHGIYFTPLLVAAHDADTHLFTLGTAATTNLQAVAEGGDISGLAGDLTAVSADIVENPAAGLLAPGASVSTMIDAMPSNNRLSLVAMLLPTNDGFVGLDALELPHKPGTYTYYLNGYDAGTEANNEIINGGATPGVLGIPADPGGNGGSGGSGVTVIETNQTVHIHRGNLGDTDPAGGISDVDSRIHRWLNPVAKLVVMIK